MVSSSPSLTVVTGFPSAPSNVRETSMALEVGLSGTVASKPASLTT